MAENTRRIAELQRELTGNPGSRQFYQLGELLRRDGRAAEAAEVLRAGLAQHPRYVAAWVALGRASLDGGAAGEAAVGLREALSLDPANPVAWRLLGEAHLALGDRPRALEAMKRCLELVPGDNVLQAAVDALSGDTAAPDSPPAPAESPATAETPLGEPPVALDAAAEPAATAEPTPLAMESFALAAPAVAGQAEATPPPPPSQRAVEPPLSTGEPFAATATLEPAAFVDTAAPLAAATTLVTPAAPATPAEVFVPAAPLEPMGEPFELTAPTGDEPVAARDPAVAEPFDTQPVAVARRPVEAPVDAMAPTAGFEFEPEPPRPGDELFTVPEREQAPALLHAVLQASASAPGVPAPQPASLTLARLYVQQQAFGEAVAVLERLLEREPDNVEASDLLALVRDMMAPLPAAPEPLAPRERKIAALQRWLACLTLGRERATP